MLGVLLAIGLQALLVARSPLIAPDGFTFIQMAQDLARSPIQTMRQQDQHPGYPLLILIVREMLLIPSGFEEPRYWITAARIATGACGVLCLVAVWWLAELLYGRSVANLSAIICAFIPLLRNNAADALSDSPHLLFYLVAACLACTAYRHKSAGLFFAVGTVSGAAFWFRPEGLSVTGVVAMMLLVVPSWRTALGWPKNLHCLVALCAAALLVISPYLLLTGKLTSKMAHKANWTELRSSSTVKSPPATAITASDLSARTASQPRLSSWNNLFALGMEAVAQSSTRIAEALRFVLLIPLLVGILKRHRGLRIPTYAPLLWSLAVLHCMLLVVLFVLGGYVERRHVMPIVGVCLPVISSGLLSLWQFMMSWNCRSSLRRIAIASGVGILIGALIPNCVRPLHYNRTHLLKAAQWIHVHSQPGDSLASNSSQLLYFTPLLGKVKSGPYLQLFEISASCQFVAILEDETFSPSLRRLVDSRCRKLAVIHGDQRLKQADIAVYAVSEKSAVVTRVTDSSGQTDLVR